jgi:hypothetical protein
VGERGVGERPAQQCAVAEAVSEPHLQRCKRSVLLSRSQ